MALSTDRESFSIVGCKGITVSDIVTDVVNGNARLIQFFTDPVNTTNRRPVLEVMIYDSDPASLQVHTPLLVF